jgi:hypothetical protein
MNMKPVFIVGTGRCGSTLLSDMLRRHPGVLSLSEFFSIVSDLGGLLGRVFADGIVDAATIHDLVCGVPPRLSLMMRHGVAMDEVLHRRDDGEVAAILQTTLPHLTSRPETLLAEVSELLRARPPSTVAEHYRALFDHLRRRFEKQLWVERSGGSLRMVPRLAKMFPDARFVHMVRDGRDCALSMSKHYGFRMALIELQLSEILGVDPFASNDRRNAGDLPDELATFLPECFDAESFREYVPPPPLCGYYWSSEIKAGLAELRELGEERVLTIHYEDLLATPSATLERLAGFMDRTLVDREWIGSCAGLVRVPRSNHRSLPNHELAELEHACRGGFDALASSS